jgi:trk system potassium uptake protein TrkH
MTGAPHRIDVHHHFLQADLVAALEREAPGWTGGAATPAWDIPTALGVMERNGIAVAVVSVPFLGAVSQAFAARCITNSARSLRVVGIVLAVVSGASAFPLATALALEQPWIPFAATFGVGLALAAPLLALGLRREFSIDHRSAFLAVTSSWTSACVLGAIAFVAHPAIEGSWVDALFESTSGFTTTGATVLSGLDDLPRSVLLWRSLMHWLGGMGIVLLGVAVLPLLGVGGLALYRAETPGVSKDRLTPRVAETGKLLWILYVGFTAVNAALLYAGGLSAFDSVCHAMSTIATGGLANHDASFAGFDSGYIRGITTIFMLLGGTSFALLHRALTQGISWSREPELRAYLVVFALAASLIALDLGSGRPERFPTAADALSHAAFQSAAVLTGTGFSTDDFARWPGLSQTVLFLLFFMGGMVGSTAGGVKILRVLLVGKLSGAQFLRLVHPHAVINYKLGPRPIDDVVLRSAAGFVILWLAVVAAGALVFASYGSDPLTAVSAAAVTLGNVGPGLGGVGPANTYADFAPGAKLVMSALMLLGRLEILTVLVIFTPAFWRG